MPAVKTKPLPSTGVQPILYQYMEGPFPPEASRGAVEMLLAWRGRATIDEVDSAISTLTAMLRNGSHSFVAGNQSVAPGLIDWSKRRSIYVRRRRTIEGIWKLPASEQPEEDLGDLVRVLSHRTRYETLDADLANTLAFEHRTLSGIDDDISILRTTVEDNEHYRHLGTESIRRQVNELAEKLGSSMRGIRRILNPVLKEVASLPFIEVQTEFKSLTFDVANAGGGNTSIWQQDGALIKIDTMLARRAAAAARISILTDDQEGVRARVGDRIKKAIKAAGGETAIVECIVATRALQAPAQVKASDDAINAVDADLQRLADAGTVTGPAAEALKTKRAEIVQGAVWAKTEAAQRARAAAGSLVIASLSGTESARAELERLAGNAAAGWPSDFAAAVAAARGDLATVAALS